MFRVKSKPDYQNQHGVVVGQLVGDGIIINIVSGSVEGTVSMNILKTNPKLCAGNMSICAYQREDIQVSSSFRVYDFGILECVVIEIQSFPI